MPDSLDLTLPPTIAQAEKLPSMPGVVVEILRLAKDETAGIQEFEQAISGDPALAIKLLKLSNSSLYCTVDEVRTLDRACMVLGLKTVQLMALSFSLRSALPRGRGAFLKEYWARSLISAVAARAFSRSLNHGLDNEAFLCGLLNQIGVLVMGECLPDEYRVVLERSGGWPSAVHERQVLGFESTSVGAALLKHWDLPASLYLSLAHASRPDEVPENAADEIRKLARTVHCARLTATLFRGTAKREALEALQATAEESGLAQNELAALLDELGAEVEETAGLLEVKFEPDHSVSDLFEVARDQVMKISLGAAAHLHQAERHAHQLESRVQDLTLKLTMDRLTGVPNREGFDQVLARELEMRAERRRPKALGLLMVDADCFKQCNDRHGHRAGDEVLRTLGRTLEQVCRDTDLPARYGGDEFAVIVPEVTPTGLVVLAERLRQAIEACVIEFEGKPLEVTASIGGACLAEGTGPRDAASLIEAADRCLYEAKRDGRNRSVIRPDLVRDAPSTGQAKPRMR